MVCYYTNNTKTNIPKLQGNLFYVCISCQYAKLRKRKTNPSASTNASQATITPFPALTSIPNTDNVLIPGQRFHIDFGFMRGSGFVDKTLDGKTITSIDGKRAFLHIIDLATRYSWVFLISSKAPPLDIVKHFLMEHGCKDISNRTSVLIMVENCGHPYHFKNVWMISNISWNPQHPMQHSRTGWLNAQIKHMPTWSDVSYSQQA